MRYENFLEKVQERTELAPDQAETVVRATLETLGERLHSTERDLLGAQLPKEMQGMLARRKQTDRYNLEEFYNRVSARADLGYPDAVNSARAVAMVLQEAVSEGEIRNMLSRLPAEYEELFGRAFQETLSPSSEY
ncbi:MAG: DUF2267 domain-containing protein [Desulfovibrionales bacterium]